MVRIFREGSNYMVQTTCHDHDSFLADFSIALARALDDEVDHGAATLGILLVAMPIAFRLSGYKAEQVSEQRTLVCGTVSPAEGTLVCTAGR